MINDKFFELPQEKQQNIINAAMYVFSRNKYKYATTDDIAARAGISKGLLFHYFGNKSGLYMYLYRYAENLLVTETGKSFNYEETDMFNMLDDAQRIKFEIMKRHPDLWEFLCKAYLEENEAVSAKLGTSFDSLVSQSCEGVLSRMDKTKFRDDVSPEMVLNLIIWMSDGYMHCHVPEQLNDVEAIYNDYQRYIGMMRRCFYKPEYQTPEDKADGIRRGNGDLHE